MKMQQESLEAKLRTGLKERQFFYPATFETLEAILRSNFTSVPNLEVVEGEDHSRPQTSRVQEVKFYADSDLANEAFEGENFFCGEIGNFFSKKRNIEKVENTDRHDEKIFIAQMRNVRMFVST